MEIPRPGMKQLPQISQDQNQQSIQTSKSQPTGFAKTDSVERITAANPFLQESIDAITGEQSGQTQLGDVVENIQDRFGDPIDGGGSKIPDRIKAFLDFLKANGFDASGTDAPGGPSGGSANLGDLLGRSGPDLTSQLNDLLEVITNTTGQESGDISAPLRELEQRIKDLQSQLFDDTTASDPRGENPYGKGQIALAGQIIAIGTLGYMAYKALEEYKEYQGYEQYEKEQTQKAGDAQKLPEQKAASVLDPKAEVVKDPDVDKPIEDSGTSGTAGTSSTAGAASTAGSSGTTVYDPKPGEEDVDPENYQVDSKMQEWIDKFSDQFGLVTYKDYRPGLPGQNDVDPPPDAVQGGPSSVDSELKISNYDKEFLVGQPNPDGQHAGGGETGTEIGADIDYEDGSGYRGPIRTESESDAVAGRKTLETRVENDEEDNEEDSDSKS